MGGFEGVFVIFLNVYFGCEEFDDMFGGGMDDYGDLESVVKDFVRRFGIIVGDDFENLMYLFGEGVGRL